MVPIGISPDAPAALKRFDTQNQLGFTLLSDPDRSVAQSYGAWGTKSMYGKVVEGIVRTVVVIDTQGRILGAWYKIKPEETVPKALSVL